MIPSPSRTLRTGALSLTLAFTLVAASCGSDDGENVRGEVTELDGGTDGGSASASGSASGSASASAPATSDGEAPAPTGTDGGYEYASNVDAHRLVVADICTIKDLIDEGDFASALAVYNEGANSVNSDGSIRTIGGFAARDDRNHGYDVYFGTPTPLDDFVTDAANGTGVFEGQADAVRAQGMEKGIQNQVMVAWVKHELVSALDKASEGNFDVQEGAVHNWDEGWAFYHGAEPGCSPWATGNSRAGNFGTLGADGETAIANEQILAAMIAGRDALLAEDADGAAAAAEDATRGLIVIYAQATIRYASLIEGDLADADTETAKEHQAEGLAFFRVIEPDIAAAGGDVDTINRILDISNEPGANGFGDEVRAALEPALGELGIDASDIGTLE